MIIPFYGVWLLLVSAVQSTVLKSIELFSVKPNLFLVFVVTIALLRGRKEGAVIGALFGIFLDITAGRLIGVYSILYLYTGFLAGLVSEIYISRAHYIFSLLFALVFTFVTEFLYCLLIMAFSEGASIGFSILHIILPEVIYNTAAEALLYIVILKSLKLIGGVNVDEY